MGRKEGWRSLWRVALLAASIWSSSFLLVEGQADNLIQIEVKPPHPIEGQTVTLTPKGPLDGAISCVWFQGQTDSGIKILTYYPYSKEQKPGDAFTHRETAGPGCTLTITNLTSGDTRNYSLSVDGPQITAQGSVSMIVSEYLTVPILVSSAPANGMVEENTNVTLNCNTSNSIDVSVSWFKDGKDFSPAAGLLDRNRTLVLVRVTKTDKGSYACEQRNFVSQQKSDPVDINVAYGPDDIKLNKEERIEVTLNSILKLECSADSVPKAEFQWLFNNISRNVFGNIFQVQLSNWTDEGNYSCLATNPFTNRTAMRTTYVKLIEGSGGSDQPGRLSDGAIAGIVIGSLAGIVLVSGLLYFICTKTSLGRKEQHASNGNVPSAPGRNEGVTDTKPKAAEEDLQYSILAFKDNKCSPPPRPTSEAPQPSDGVTIYSEIKKK